MVKQFNKFVLVLTLLWTILGQAQEDRPCPNQMDQIAPQVENGFVPVVEKLQSNLCDSIEVEGRILMLDDNSRKNSEHIQALLRNALVQNCKKNTRDFVSMFDYEKKGLALTIYLMASLIDKIEQSGHGELEKVTFNGKSLPAKYSYSSGAFISDDYTGVQMRSLYRDNLKIDQVPIQFAKSEVALGLSQPGEVQLNGFKLQFNLRGDDYAYEGERADGTVLFLDYERNGDIHQGVLGGRMQTVKKNKGTQVKTHADLILLSILLADDKEKSFGGAGFGVRAGAEFQQCLNDKGTSRICYVADGSISLFGGFQSAAVSVNVGTGISFQQDLNSNNTSYLYVNGMLRGQVAVGVMEGGEDSGKSDAGIGFGYAPSLAVGVAY